VKKPTAGRKGTSHYMANKKAGRLVVVKMREGDKIASVDRANYSQKHRLVEWQERRALCLVSQAPVEAARTAKAMQRRKEC